MGLTLQARVSLLLSAFKTHPSFPHLFAALQTEAKPVTALGFAAARGDAAAAAVGFGLSPLTSRQR